MSCTIPAIENRYRQSNPELADKLNQQTFDTWNTLLDSKLFEEKDNELYVNKEGTKKRVKQNELIDSINNSKPKEGVDFLFEQNPKLSKIGNQQQYSQYLDSIFPDSKVKDIVYHGTQFGKFDKFDKNQLGKNTEAPSSFQGFFFSNSKSTAGSYAQKSEKDWGEISLEESIERNENSKDNNNLYYELVEKSDYIDKRNPFGEGSVFIKSKNKELFFGEFEDFTNEHKKVLDDLKVIENKSKLLKKQNNKLQLFNVILNIKNPKIEDKKGESGNINQIIKSAKTVNDGVILNNYKDPFVSDVFVVFEPEQIHILSSKADIQGFKNFVQGKQFQKLTAEEKAKTIEQVTKKHRSITALKDLSAKLAWRIGGKVEFDNKTDVDWKGYNQGMTSVLNEAYMDESTAFHEIMGHPIIRALKSMSSQKESVTLQQMVDNQEIEKICN